MSQSGPRRPPAVRSDRGSASPTPGWVKGFGIIVVALLVLFVVLHLTGNGMSGHG